MWSEMVTKKWPLKNGHFTYAKVLRNGHWKNISDAGNTEAYVDFRLRKRRFLKIANSKKHYKFWKYGQFRNKNSHFLAHL